MEDAVVINKCGPYKTIEKYGGELKVLKVIFHGYHLQGRCRCTVLYDEASGEVIIKNVC